MPGTAAYLWLAAEGADGAEAAARMLCLLTSRLVGALGLFGGSGVTASAAALCLLEAAAATVFRTTGLLADVGLAGPSSSLSRLLEDPVLCF